MSKATFPETAGVESLKPIDGGSFSASDIRNALSALFQGDMGALRPRAQTVPDMTVHVNPITLNSFFQQVWGTGNSPLSFGGGNTSVFTAPSANPRIDIVYLNSSGAVAVVTGAEAASPSANWASLPKDGIPICLVYHRASETKIVNFEDKDANPNDGYIYMDVRPFLNLGGGASLVDMQAAQDNIALLAFRLAVQGSLTVQKMEDGIVDEYEDETGIDTVASQNENYDSASDCYSPTDAQDLCAGGSPVSGGDENLTGDIIPDSNDKLALNMNGSGASFVDSSPSPKAVTAYGNATQLEKKLNRTAGFFNGTSDYLLVPDHADWVYGSAVTMEVFANWASLSASAVYRHLVTQYTNGNTAFNWYIMQVSGTWYYNFSWCSGGGWVGQAQVTIPAPSINTWYHYAFSMDASGNGRFFINGVQQGATVTGLPAFSIDYTGPLTIGGYNATASWHGWLKELRISNSARYTANFTPTTTPFTSDANTKLLLHFDTLASAPLGPAAYFDGSSDYLSVADHPDWDFGTGDFTVECFAMFEANQFSGLIDVGDGNGGAGVTMFYHQSDSNFENRINGISFARGYTWTPTPYKWYHLAFVRSAGYATMYVDGRPLGAAQASSHNVVVSAACVIGRWNANTSYMHKGFIREVRISNSARYTAAFTPSQTPFTADANTKLLLHLDESNGATSFVDSETTPKSVTVYGDVKIKYTEDYRSCIFKDDGNTGHKPYAGSSAKLDFIAPFGEGCGSFDRNSTSYLLVPNSSDFDFGTGLFTWELYFRTPTDINNTAYGTMMAKYLTPSQGWIWYMDMRDSYKNFDIYDYNNSGRRLITPLQNFAPNTWYHLAVTGDGSNLRAFVNGILQGSAAYGGSGYNGGAITPSIGSYNNGSWSSGILGLMDNVRISKGVARYTANFNPTPNVGTNPKEGAFDDSTSTWWGSVQTGANVSGAAYVGYNFGSPVTPKAFTIKQHANYIGSVKVQRSSDGSSWVDVQTVTISENSTKNAYSFSNSTAAQCWRLLANDNPSSGSWQVEEIEFMVGAKNDMTLISNGFTAEATPAEIRIVLFEEDVDSLELNTDLKAWVSRDGGTTWTQITIVDEGDYESNKRILAGSISVSGQPSGAAVKYKVTTHNNRNMKFHGASLGWKA